jgi:hypothetical protein
MLITKSQARKTERASRGEDKLILKTKKTFLVLKKKTAILFNKKARVRKALERAARNRQLSAWRHLRLWMSTKTKRILKLPTSILPRLKLKMIKKKTIKWKSRLLTQSS